MTARSSKDADKIIGARIKAARLNAGLSQDDLARAIGVTFQQIQKYEKGVNRVAMSTAMGMEAALKVPAASLFPASAVDGDKTVDPATALAQSSLGIELARIFVAMAPERQTSLMSVARVLA